MSDLSFTQTLDYRIAVGRFESALEASERLSDADREALLRDVAKQILQLLLPMGASRVGTTAQISNAVHGSSEPNLTRPLAPSLAPSGCSPSLGSPLGSND
jgi:hypothetical protein